MSATDARVARPRHPAAPVYGTITRTLARARPMTINLPINRGDPEELPHAD